MDNGGARPELYGDTSSSLYTRVRAWSEQGRGQDSWQGMADRDHASPANCFLRGNSDALRFPAQGEGMKPGIAMLLLLFSLQASGQAVYKCVGKGGAVSYQSELCDNGRPTKAWAATPEPEPTDAQLRARLLAQERAQAESRELAARAGRAPEVSSARSGAAQGAAIPIGGSACAEARAKRDAWLRSDLGFSAGVDTRRSWDDFVWNACK